MANEIVFPQVVSCENETRGVIGVADSRGKIVMKPVEPRALMSYMRAGPQAIRGTEFNRAGGKDYVDSNGIEMALAECPDPVVLNTYNIATDMNYLDALGRYAMALHYQNDQRAVRARYPRRVRDSKSNTWACHDNIDIPLRLAELLSSNVTKKDDRSIESEILLRHLTRRPFLSGAGVITDEGFRLSQKIDSVTTYNDYGYKSSHYRIDKEHGVRLEIRDSDRNVKNAATALRLGSTVLVAAMLQTPLKQFMVDESRVSEPQEGQWFNQIEVNPDGTVNPSVFLQVALGTEMHYATLARDMLSKYVEVPRRYQKIASEWYSYCEVFGSIMRGEETIDALVDWSDWAHKMRLILDYKWAFAIRHDGAQVPYDRIRAIDQAYDWTTINIQDRTISRIDGPGVKTQFDKSQPYAAKKEAVERARTKPPRTRASHRVHTLVTADGINSSNWASASVQQGGRTRKVKFLPKYTSSVAKK